ncbi:MAG TPA: anthranilate phosphoribosyltransferase [Acidobacteria bacterium]|nr:anthranilate phosphoribosyltransferase [Acidobacteriota bacterium]
MSTPALDRKGILRDLMAGRDIGAAAVESVFEALMDGELDPAWQAGFLVALRTKGETGEELAAAARVLRRRAVAVTVADPAATVDTCGTGGDGGGTLNISTAAALVAAAAGAPVAKHGNRSVSSRCGSADVLEAAGVRLDLGPGALAALIDELGIAFLFAPALHPAMGAVMPVRRALAVRTTFNLLGPLANPAAAGRQLLGVWGPEVQDLVAGALAGLGAVHALVVHSCDGLDELSVAAPTDVVEVREGRIVRRFTVDPSALGIDGSDPGSLAGGDVEHNTRRLRQVLEGERSTAAEAVALNAGAALHVAGLAADLPAGLELARETLASGAATGLLDALARRSQELAGHG